MAKFNIQYVKSHPVMFGTIIVVFGLLFWFLLNGRGSGAGSGVSVYNSGPSDAQVQAGMARDMAQLQSNTQLGLAQLQLQGQGAQIAGQNAIATMEMQLRVQELASQHELGALTIESSLAALTAQLTAQTDMQSDNNAFMIAYAKNAQDSATMQVMINAALQRDLGAQQLDAFKTSSILSQIGTLKKKNRDETLQILGSSILGDPVAFTNRPHNTTIYGSANGGTAPAPIPVPTNLPTTPTLPVGFGGMLAA